MSRQTPYHPPQQQRPLAAPPPPTPQLPTEIAIVCVVDDSARTADRWNDIVKEGGYLDRFVQRLSAGAGVAKQLRLSLLSYSSQSSPLQTPITHTQYFLAPTEFWTSVRQPRPPTASGSNSSPPASPGAASTSSGGGGEQGLLEGLVGGIELFDLHTSHPFALPTPSPSPPYIPQHPIPSSASSTSSNTSPQNLSHLSPPNSNNAQHSSSSTHPQPSPRPNVERYLFVFLGDDPSPTAISSLPSLPAETVSSKKIGRWGKKPSSSASGSTVGGAGGGGKVRWNRTRKLDGVGWDELSQEMRKRGVRSSLVGMGVGTGEGEMKRLKELFKKNSFSSNDPAWFPTAKGDLLLLYGLDPTKTHLKRPHSQTSPPSVASPSSLASSLPQKRQRVAAPGGLAFPPPSVPSQTSNPTSSAALHAQLQQQQQQQRIPDVQDIQAHRIQAAQRMLANNPAAAAQLAARGQGQGMLPPSLGGVPGIPLNIQSQFAAVASVAAANNGGGAGGPSFDLASSGNAEALQQQWHRQRLQAQVSAAATTSSPVVPPPPSLPNHQQHQQQQQQRPSQQQQSRPTVWSGDLGWQVNGSAKGQPNLGCRIIAASATKNTPEDFQPHLWGERIQISSAVSFRMDELKLYASKGTPCVGIRYSPDPMASAEERASGERSFLLLTNSLSAKQIAGVIKMGPSGCGMLVFPMSQTNKSAQNPSGSAQLMGMVFLRAPIPAELIRPLNSNAPHPNNSQQNSSHNQQQQHHQILQPPNLTIKTGHQQQQQQQLAMERAQAAMILQKQQHQQKLQQLQLQQQQQQQLQNQQQHGQQPNLNFPNGGINLASAGLYGGSGSVGAGMTGVSDQQMAEFLKSYPPAGQQQQGGQQPRWP